MPEIQPFRGVRYRVPAEDLARVLCPPYDVISPSYQRELHDRDRRNIVRVVLTRTPGEPGYDEAGATYRGWMAAGLLAPDAQPTLYLLAQEFEVAGRTYTRHGLLARFRAEDPEKGGVLPHEQTRREAKEDRYKLLKATRANFSPIFLMFSDEAGGFAAVVSRVTAAPPETAYTDDGGVRHALWLVTDAATIAKLQALLAPAKAYIADGHHRYATALRYRDEVGPAGAWTLGYFTPLEAKGLVVLPYHRLLDRGPSLEEARHALGPAFTTAGVPSARAAAHEAAQSTMPYAFGLAECKGAALVAEALPETADLLPADTPPSLSALDTYFLHQAVLPNVLRVPDDAVRYAHSMEEVEEAVGKGGCHLAVLMRPTPVRQIVDVAEARQSMPAKSTFFHPKLPSGLVIHQVHG